MTANLHPIHALSDELVESICRLSPVSATFVGAHGHDDRWDDFGPDGVASRAASLREFASRLSALPAPTDAASALAIRVHREYLDERLEFHASADPYRDLNNITSTFQILTMVFDFADPSTDEGKANIAARLATFADAVRSYRALLDAGLEGGHVVARRQVEAAIGEGRAKAGTFRRRFGDAGAPADAIYAELTAWLESTYLPKATGADGVGRERYERAMRRYLGATLDPLETYAWGWEEVRRIEAAMTKVAQSIAPGKTTREVAALLAADPKQSLAIPEPFLEAMRARQAHALSSLVGTHFDVPEAIRPLEIKFAPAGGKPGAYYTAPAEDLSRPGTVWYSAGERSAIALWQEITTAYHEGFPGHHLQVGTQVFQAERLTRFQRIFADWPGFSEGWALYAEELMLELGFFEKPEYVLGMYAGQLARACRVVVDIGLHLGLTIPNDVDFHPGERWSYPLAVEMMRERALLEPSVAESEVVRYLGWPGQAISYKVGQRVLLDMRAECMRREGARFDLKRFHADVLGLGGVGLGALRATLLES